MNPEKSIPYHLVQQIAKDAQVKGFSAYIDALSKAETKQLRDSLQAAELLQKWAREKWQTKI
jgi:hypothetical protein